MAKILTLSRLERLALLLEELGEAQQVIGKILRHGYDSRHPDGGPSPKGCPTSLRDRRVSRRVGRNGGWIPCNGLPDA